MAMAVRIFKGVYMKKIFVLILLVAVVTGMSSCRSPKELREMERQREENSDVHKMGGMLSPVNTDYDVSRYRITVNYYKLNASDMTISESELKTYAESRLQEITEASDIRVMGKYQDFDFLIIRRDRYDEWKDTDSMASVYYNWSARYFSACYTVSFEFAGYHTSMLDVYKDPSDKFLIITNCNDYKVITEFFAD